MTFGTLLVLRGDFWRFCWPEQTGQICNTVNENKRCDANISPRQGVPGTDVRKGFPAHSQIRGIDVTNIGNGQTNHVVADDFGFSSCV